MTRRCKLCGKEFEPNSYNHTYCDNKCTERYNDLRGKIKRKIKQIAKEFDFNVQNEKKIVNAKLMLFKHDNVFRCPCDAQNPKRYCGSAQCIADTVNNGHCHCNLFHKKED